MEVWFLSLAPIHLHYSNIIWRMFGETGSTGLWKWLDKCMNLTAATNRVQCTEGFLLFWFIVWISSPIIIIIDIIDFLFKLRVHKPYEIQWAGKKTKKTDVKQSNLIKSDMLFVMVKLRIYYSEIAIIRLLRFIPSVFAKI